MEIEGKYIPDSLYQEWDTNCSGRSCMSSKGCSQVHCYPCSHRFCDRIAFVIGRVELYAKYLGIDSRQVLDRWEKGRNYWYMNYYQEYHFPVPDGAQIYETLQDIKDDGSFVCPACRQVTESPIYCQKCGNKAYDQFFGTLGKGRHVIVRETGRVYDIFKREGRKCN